MISIYVERKQFPVLWRCWLSGRKGIRPVKKTEWWGAGVVICLEQSADLHMARLMPLPLTVSCFSKIEISFTFLVPAHPVVPEKGPLNGCILKRAHKQYPLRSAWLVHGYLGQSKFSHYCGAHSCAQHLDSQTFYALQWLFSGPELDQKTRQQECRDTTLLIWQRHIYLCTYPLHRSLPLHNFWSALLSSACCVLVKQTVSQQVISLSYNYQQSSAFTNS